MIISVEEAKKRITTTLDDSVLEDKLKALEISVRNYTNNKFQNRNIRAACQVMAQKLYATYPYFKEGDTVEISQSIFNDGLYTVVAFDGEFITLDRALVDENPVLVTKIEYPADVKEGVLSILKWQLKNEAANDGDTSKKDIQSETISRHSVTYVTDSTELDIDERLGVPKKYSSFLRQYRKARF